MKITYLKYKNFGVFYTLGVTVGDSKVDCPLREAVVWVR